MVWNPGQQLFGDRYIIEQYLGKGGIGITYLAKNKQGQLRVIKTLREEILNDPLWQPHQYKLKQDFKEEALRLALCRHPHIVEVENVFDDGDLPCMAMEYIEGEDLGKRITLKGALPEAEALQYIGQIGDALILVHEKGLLHRDLKPSNIMMRAGKPKAVLIDFGLARQFIPGAVQRHTESRTDGYAPPEQYIPDAERGEYIDVYALAATLYSLLTGQLPMPVPVRLQNFTLQPPKELNSSVGDKVNEAIMRGMALNYKFRPQSVQEWLDLLGAGIVRPTQPAIPSWECAQIIPGISSQIALSPKGDILACAAGSLIHLYSSTTGELLRTLTGHSGIVRSIAISSDGQLLASYSDEDSIRLWDVATGRTIRTFTGHSGMSSLAFSNDGQFLASGDGYAIRLWDVATGRTIRTFTRPHPSNIVGAYLTIAISSDGQLLASCSDHKTIRLWDVATGRKIRTFTGHSDRVYPVAISRDGQLLASCMDDRTIKLWDVATGREIRTFTGHFNRLYSVAISSNGQLLASCMDDRTIKLWDVATGREIRTFTGHSGIVRSIAISSDGQLLASIGGGYKCDNTIKLWDVQTGKEICTLSNSYGVRSVAFIGDDNWLATGTLLGNIIIWRRS
ncbi:serine/threonine protein kinase [Anabaena minutissima FACHB-250]|nr:serine/threonine protein kinase [Anabaena minutissima FACHB-250]